NNAIECCQRLALFVLGAKRIPRSEDVTRVDANGEPRFAPRAGNDVADMLEPMAQATPLPGRRLEPNFDRRGFAAIDGQVEGANNLRDSLGLARVGARTGMNDESNEPQRFRTLKFFDERLDRLLPEFRLRAGQVDQVARVGARFFDPRAVNRLVELPNIFV